MLIYTGKGSWFPGIPARDLTAEEVEKFGGVEYLLSLGLYEQPTPKKQGATKAKGGPKENKSEDD